MDIKRFLSDFNALLISDFPNILDALQENGSWSDGMDTISLVHSDDGRGISSIMVDWFDIRGNAAYFSHRFSVPKFLDILVKRKQEYIQLHPQEKEAVESKFEKFEQATLSKWTSQ